MQLWTAFLLGFVGSAHCAGMCGPLALALPHWGRGQSSFVAGRLLYNLGRIATYAAMGTLFGLLGKSFALAGIQRWVSLTLGAAILVGLLISPRFVNAVPVTRAVNTLKSRLGFLLQRRGLSVMFGIGLLNGLLPCGLLYAACATAITSENVPHAIAYMTTFGLGTLPMMLAISLLGTKLRFAFRLKMQRLIPFALAVVGLLLLFRGMALGIPYVSPRLSNQPSVDSCCHGMRP